MAKKDACSASCEKQIVSLKDSDRITQGSVFSWALLLWAMFS